MTKTNRNKMKSVKVLIVGVSVAIVLMLLSLVSSAQNYLFVGIDSRNPNFDDRANADMIMIMHVGKTGTRLASVMRDTYVDIPGHGKNKINAAYRLGGIGLLIQTLNTNFGLALDPYVVVDFINSTKAIDLLKGVTVEVDEMERQQINAYIHEQNMHNPKNYKIIEKTGWVTLDGGQALAYCRVRTDGDRSRTGRQREVFKEFIKKASSEKLDLKTWRALYSMFQTDIPQEAGMAIAAKVLTFDKPYPKDNQVFPLPEDVKAVTVPGVGKVISTDIKKTGSKLRAFIQ